VKSSTFEIFRTLKTVFRIARGCLHSMLKTYSPPPSCLVMMAAAIITKQEGGGEYVFNMEWRHPRAIRKTVFRVRKISKVEDFTFHQIRHFVSTYLSSAVSLATAQTVLGHQDIKTTLRYTHPDLDEQRKGVRKIEKFIKNL